jgi:membrane protease YdiL (CAAX protease family)
LFLVGAVGADIARPLPRHPRTTAIVLLGAAARFALFVAKACGHGVHPVIALAALFAVAGAIAVWTRSPAPSAVTRGILARLRIDAGDGARSGERGAGERVHSARSDAGTSERGAGERVHSARSDAGTSERGAGERVQSARNGARAADSAGDVRVARNPAPRALLLGATLAAVGLPVMLAAAQRFGVGLWPRAALYAGYAAIAPMAIERALEARARRAPFAIPQWLPRIALATAAAFALSLGLTNGVHFGADAVAYAARCVSPATGAAQRLLDAEAHEVTRNLQQARVEWAFFAMNVIVVPLAEERVYRDFLQRVLARRVGAPRAIAAASSIFALAHLDVYRVAVYQMVPLGIACGVAYEEGGLVAAALTHALWNLHLLL